MFDNLIEDGQLTLSAADLLNFKNLAKVAGIEKDFPELVPTMPATVLGLEIVLHAPVIDLQMASELVLADVGATLKILNLSGRAVNSMADRPHRMSDCLANLEASVWFDSLAARTFSECELAPMGATALWGQCREIAQYSELVAKSIGCVAPQDAYLVGLLYRAADIPAVLGFSSTRRDFQDSVEDILPQIVFDALRGLSDPTCPSYWRYILCKADKLANESRTAKTDSVGRGNALREVWN